MVTAEDIRICPHCHITILTEDHPSKYGWVKCQFCGFCEPRPIKKKDHGSTKHRKK